jgi:hypothetical protein
LIGEEQNGFRKGRSWSDGYFSLKLIIEKHREFNIETHLAFVDFKKTFHKVNRKKLMEILKADNIPNQLIASIYNIYKNNLIALTMESELSEWKHIAGGVRKDALFHRYYSLCT